jgi:hypothetical protein
MEPLAEFKQLVQDAVHRYNSVMPEAQHLANAEIGEKFIRALLIALYLT